MTSETGNPNRIRPRCGFSLVEIILVIGLIAIAASMVIASFSSMAEGGDSRTTQEWVHEAVRKARFLAASERTVTALRFDEETGSLQITGDRVTDASYPLGDAFRAGEGSGRIRFYLVPPSEGLTPYNEGARSRMEAKEVRFAPDRSSTPFAIEIDTGSGTPQRLVYDPFSSLQRQQEKD